VRGGGEKAGRGEERWRGEGVREEKHYAADVGGMGISLNEIYGRWHHPAI